MSRGLVEPPKILGILRDARVAVFDLDGTLYDDATYYQAADQDIVRHVAATAGMPVEQAAGVVALSQRDGRAGYLDRVCCALDLPRTVIADLLHLLRTADARLIPYPWVEALLADLDAHGVSLYILTNGHRQQQQNKIRSLDLDTATVPVEVVYTADHRSKPDPAGLRHILATERVDAQEAVLVGNELADELCALACGVTYIDVGQLASGLADPPAGPRSTVVTTLRPGRQSTGEARPNGEIA